MANSKSAAAQALEITEILVLILRKVDMHTLLVSCPRVCRYWKASIDSFESLQRKLFFLKDELATPTHNRLLAKHFPFAFEHADAPPERDLRFFSRTTKLIAPKHDVTFPDLPWIRDRQDAYRRPEASWRRMLVHQPPFPGVGWVGTRRSKEVMFHCIPTPRESLRIEELLRAVLSGFPTEHATVDRVARSFRVIWRHVPPDIVNAYPNARAGVLQSTVNTLRQVFAEQWSAFGIIVHQDVDDLVYASPDPQQFILYDLLQDDED
ncbi:hypothetical protein PFICI_09239 [Pestalotiopsis fici W106-1]|uniref:F-box domain-containing protein n=1 Tax=Pestalotiopsis fici (strain W106-1 / CGMCC3.15140) TaxID=1229662 RepID=W3X2K1_PESFW|nr:uncharacterized protein PFICI_09239 [Pestalotiopsis fici W106-1]ETS79386.1 hypothetical protein PFICI_09239 [Pestalotiopsis fici W106-1]